MTALLWLHKTAQCLSPEERIRYPRLALIAMHGTVITEFQADLFRRMLGAFKIVKRRGVLDFLEGALGGAQNGAQNDAGRALGAVFLPPSDEQSLSLIE